jgi:hypothetical protein
MNRLNLINPITEKGFELIAVLGAFASLCEK